MFLCLISMPSWVESFIHQNGDEEEFPTSLIAKTGSVGGWHSDVPRAEAWYVLNVSNLTFLELLIGWLGAKSSSSAHCGRYSAFCYNCKIKNICERPRYGYIICAVTQWIYSLRKNSDTISNFYNLPPWAHTRRGFLWIVLLAYRQNNTWENEFSFDF